MSAVTSLRVLGALGWETMMKLMDCIEHLARIKSQVSRVVETNNGRALKDKAGQVCEDAEARDQPST